MGQVFLAKSTGLGGFVRHVVLKTLDLPGTDEDEAVGMFLDEARLLGRLHHQHITPIFEVGKDDDGGLFLVMDYVHGHTAHDAWQRTIELGAALPLDFSLTVAAAAASGLHYAHTRRDAEGRPLHIVHRDVSLSNLMIGFDGGVKLIDFGIAKAANRSTQTQAGFIKGKVGYMAPEQLRGQAVDARTDVFALGIVLYELTTMRRAFRDESDHTTMQRIRDGKYTPPTALNREYPMELERIVARALRVDPRERYPNAEAMRRELDLLGHQLGFVLGDAAVVEVMSQLYEQRTEPWEQARPTRPETDLEVPLEIEPSLTLEDEHSRKTLTGMALRAATEAAESQLATPPHGVPKRPSSFNINLEGVAKPPVSNDTDGVMLKPPDPAASAAARVTAGTADTEALPTLMDVPPAPGTASEPAAEAPAASATESPAASRRARAERPTRQSRPLRAPRPPAAPRRRLAIVGWAAAAFAVAAAVTGGVYFLQGSGSGPAEAKPTEVGSGPAPGSATPPQPPAPRREPSAPPTQPAARPPIVLPPGAQLRISIKTTPPDATVLLDQKRLGRTPYNGTVDAAAGTHTLKIRKRGYATVTLDIPLDADISRDVVLQRAKEPPGGGSGGSGAGAGSDLGPGSGPSPGPSP
jgi:serine/threonine protein kinase